MSSSEFFTVGPVVLAFPSVFEPSAPRGSNAQPRYNTNILVTPQQYADVIAPQIQKLIAEAFKNNEASNPQFAYPFYECKYKADTYPGGAAQGLLHGNLKSQFPIEVVDSNRQPIIDPGTIKDGAKVYVSMNLYSYNKMGKAGIAAGLGPIMYISDGEALNVSGGVNAAQAFSGVQVETAVPQTASAPVQQPPVQQAAPTQAAGMAPPPPPPGN